MADEPENDYDAGDQKKQAKKEAKAKVRRDEELDFWRAVLATYEGRAVLWKALERCKIFRFGFTGDSNLLHFNEGERSIGGWVMDELFSSDPTAYAKMRFEHEKRLEKGN